MPGHLGLLWLVATHPDALPRWRPLDRLRAHAPAFADAVLVGLRGPTRVAAVVAWAAVFDALRLAWLWAALHAVGVPASVDLAVEALAVSTLLGLLSVLPAGLGTFDAGLLTLLHAGGVPIAPAGAAVLLYRAAELWVPLAGRRSRRAHDPADPWRPAPGLGRGRDDGLMRVLIVEDEVPLAKLIRRGLMDDGLLAGRRRARRGRAVDGLGDPV